MSVYLIAEVTVDDPKVYAEYDARVPATVERYGGRYLVRCDHVLALAGGWTPERVVIIEWDSVDHLRTWLYSPEYLALAPLQEQSTTSRSIVVEGCLL